MKAAERTSKPRHRAAGGIWLLGMACGVATAFAPAYAVMATILLAPALLAAAADATPGRASARPVLVLGAASAIAPLGHLWSSGPFVANAFALARDPHTLALAWSTQGATWLAAEAVPAVLRLLLDGRARSRAAALRRARRALEEEWAIPPANEVT
jgi:hypothetical protein